MEKPDLQYIDGYTRSDGTYVNGHWRTEANHTIADNLGTDVDGDGIPGYFDATPEGVTSEMAVLDTSSAQAETSVAASTLEMDTVAEGASALVDGDMVTTAAGGAIGGGVSYAFYMALKEFLSLEGARQRGEIRTSEVISRVTAIAWKSGKTGFKVGLIVGLAVLIFGQWILTPLLLVAPFAGAYATAKLFKAYWDGLDARQRRELKDLASELGEKINRFLDELDSPETGSSYSSNR